MGSHTYNQDQKPGLLHRVVGWLAKRSEEFDSQEKGRLCAPCTEFCGDELCQKIGCLNMDMRTNALRLKSLVRRLEDRGYEFPIEDKDANPDNVFKLDDFRKK